MAANEACMGICSEPHTYRSHSVVLLPIHDEGEQPIQWDDESNLETAAENGKMTKLTDFFRINDQNYPDRIEGLKYKDVPSQFLWDETRARRGWVKRKIKSNTIGRFALVPLGLKKETEYFLRLLLLHVPNPTSFENIRTIDDEVYPSYRETCVAMGLVKDDNEAEKALSEIVATHQSGASIRVSFAVFLVFLRPPNALNLWEKFKNDLCDDIRHRDECDEVTDVHIQIALHEIQGYLQEHDTCLEFFGLPVPTSNMEELRAQTSTAFELNDEQIRINKLDLEKEVAEMTANISKVTGQSNAFDAIMNAVKGSGMAVNSCILRAAAVPSKLIFKIQSLKIVRC